MPHTVRKVGGREELDQLWQATASLIMLAAFSHGAATAIGNGTTAGRLRTNASVTGKIAGVDVTKASTDNLWDLSAEAATGAAAYRAYWLYINAAGAASVAAGADAASAAGALAALPAHDEAKCIVGVFVAGPSTNFANALAAQGTIHNGIPAGVPCGVPRKTYIVPARTNLVAP